LLFYFKNIPSVGFPSPSGSITTNPKIANCAAKGREQHCEKHNKHCCKQLLPNTHTLSSNSWKAQWEGGRRSSSTRRTLPLSNSSLATPPTPLSPNPTSSSSASTTTPFPSPSQKTPFTTMLPMTTTITTGLAAAHCPRTSGRRFWS